jgi:glyoxylase-like metal-dependent hydrolase (beta-lactamase superfamily II)
MRIHHLNCISTCPLGGALMDGRSTQKRGRLACHCLLIEMDDQLVLIDTGFGLRDVADPKARIHGFFLRMLDPDFRQEMTAIRQIQALGLDPNDVRHIVLTHLDFDHAGGLDDFPNAAVHMMARERESATAQRTVLDRMRYRPQQWSTRANWRVYEPSGEPWLGFDCVRQLEGLPPEILLVPLVGHTFGHAGVAVNVGGRWLLHAGDAYFFHAEMNVDSPYCVPGLRWYQTLMEKNRKDRLANQQRLRTLRRAHSGEVEIFCAHDLVELERLSSRSAQLSAASQADRRTDSDAPPQLDLDGAAMRSDVQLARELMASLRSRPGTDR